MANLTREGQDVKLSILQSPDSRMDVSMYFQLCVEDS